MRPLCKGAGAVFLAATAAIASVVPPQASVAQDQRFLMQDTRTIALDWIEANIPPGTSIAREDFTPQVPLPRYRSGWAFEIFDHPLSFYREAGVGYLIVSSYNFDRFSSYPEQGSYYAEVLAMPVVLDVSPEPQLTGPRIVIVGLTPAS